MTGIKDKDPPQGKIEKFSLPLPISKSHKNINMYTAFIYANGHDFLHTKPGKFNFLSVKYCISRSSSTMITGLDIVKQTYEMRGFEIDNILVKISFIYKT